jgi:hypothetical protein
MIANSEALRAAQEKISRRIFELLGLTHGHHDAPPVPDAPRRVEATRKRTKPPLPPASLEAGKGEGSEEVSAPGAGSYSLSGLPVRVSAYRGRSEVTGGGSKRRF